GYRYLYLSTPGQRQPIAQSRRAGRPRHRAGGCSAQGYSAMTRSRTVLIGVDGATFSVLDALMEQGVMPFLKGFVASGVRAQLDSVIPPLTPPAWVSIMTGRSPSQ